MRSHWIVPSRQAARPALFTHSPARNFAPFERLFSDVWRGSESGSALAEFAPKVDVEDSDTELRLSAELPGLEEKDFEVTINADVLSIKGEKRAERGSESEGWTERTSGSFERRFRLPFEADPDSVTATFKNGLLTVVVPKPAEEQPQVRTIPVSAE
jgi:HSP20 family protein